MRWSAVALNDGWTLTLRVSGGFAGVDRTLQVTNSGGVTAIDHRRSQTATSTASPALLAELIDLDRRLTNVVDPAPSVCHDCLIYELTFRPETGQSRVWRLDDRTREPADLVGLVTSLADALNGALAK